jgi:hypothetical protein
MDRALIASHTPVPVPVTGAAFPMVPWRDPQTVSRQDIAAYINGLGMAHAVNYDVPKSMDALEQAVALDPENFWAQLKYSELHYRLRTLGRAEEETLKALHLANDPWQLSLARKQLQTVRSLRRSSVRDIEWNRSLVGPTIVLSLMLLTIFATMMWK